MRLIRKHRFDPKVSNPWGEGVYYQCERCGVRLDSMSPRGVACSCQNLALDVDAGRIAALDPRSVVVLFLAVRKKKGGPGASGAR
jgi:hypothetical protein